MFPAPEYLGLSAAYSTSPTPLVSLQKSGWIGLGQSRVFLMDALGGYHTLRELLVQELGLDAEAELFQRAGFASAERLITAGINSGDLTPDAAGFTRAVALFSSGGYGTFTVQDLRFEDQFARITADNSVEGWTFRETATRPASTCDFARGVLAGIMHFLSVAAEGDDIGEPDATLDVRVACVESQCVAAGEEFCHFTVGTSNLLAAEGLQPSLTAHSSVRETLLRLNRQLEQILDSSRKDPLTKLYNRSFFEAALRQKVGYAKRRSDVVSLAVIDIDHFKGINDSQGHMAGDRVLRQIARTLESQARENDVVARLGGDEFIWLMPATPPEAATAVAHRLQRCMLDLSAQVGFECSASIGVAGYPNDAQSPAGLYDSADRALFAAKRAGRDQIVEFASLVASGAANLVFSPGQIIPDPSEQPVGSNGSTPAAGTQRRGRAARTTIEPAVLEEAEAAPPATDSEPKPRKFRKVR